MFNKFKIKNNKPFNILKNKIKIGKINIKYYFLISKIKN